MNIDYIPTRSDFDSIGMGKICTQIGRAGGFEHIGNLMGFPNKRRSNVSCSYIKWDENKIKNSILNVMGILKIDRMPSRNEIQSVQEYNGLASAISKSNKGYYGYAKELGLKIKDSETKIGKKYEYIAYEKLQNIGYSVLQMPQNFAYDILLNSSVKIDIKFSYLYKGVNGNFYSYNLEKPYCTCDVYILISKISESCGDLVYRIVPSKFVYNNTQISVGEITSKYNKYIDRWDYIEQYNKFYKTVL